MRHLRDIPLLLVNRNRRRLPFPTTPKLRIAQITTTANRFCSSRLFAPKIWDQLAEFRPQVLIGDVADIQRLSKHARLIGFDPKHVDHAIVVLTSCLEEPLTDLTRTVLWNAFGAPIYEAIVALSGAIVAAECIAHEGWHLEPGVTPNVTDGKISFQIRGQKRTRTSFAGELITQACPCGRSGLRFTNVAAQESVEQPLLAAIA